tara:strand:- start:21712 stop:24207 length:2496 start_codon:yes stop_codon:yes gene_type:complete
MGTLFLVLSCLIVTGAVAYARLNRFIWPPIVLGCLILGQLGGFIHFSAFALWPIFFLATALAHIPSLRKKMLTGRIFKFFQEQLPPLSETEKAAIDAGDVGWEAKLFQGQPNWQELLSIAKPALKENEQSFMDNQVNTLCQMTNDWEIIQEQSDLPAGVWEYLKREKFFGMMIPKEYGGLGFSALMHSTVIARLASRSLSLATTAMVPNSLGPGELLIKYGTEEQKKYYLPRLAKGQEIPCFALTGPEAGSDAGAIPDKGIVCKGQFEGKEVVGIRLNFDKRYITLAPVSTLIGLAFKLYDPENLLGKKVNIGITLGLIPANYPGVEVGNRHFPLRMGFMNGPIRGQNVFIPLDWIIGGVKNAGLGWGMLFECLSVGRGISLPALSTAMGVLSYRMTGAYAAIRKQFNTAIGEFEGVEEPLSRIGGHTYTLEANRLFTAGSIDQGMRPAVATAIAKYHATELSRLVLNDAMDIHAGRGVMMGPYNYLASHYQSLPLGITVEGANILTRSLMIFGQGAIRCHPYLKDELLTIDLVKTDSKKAFNDFDRYCTKHIGYAISNFARTLALSLTGGRVSGWTQEKFLVKPIQKMNWLSASLAWFSDIAMLTLGGNLKRKERLSARLGDVLSALYLGSAVIKYYHDGAQTEEDKVHAQWSLEYNLYQAQEALYELIQNYPIRSIAIAAKWMIFPFGRSINKPSDKLSQKVATQMLQPSQFRTQLTQNCFVGQTVEDPTGLMELTFEKFHAAKSALDKLNLAIKKKDIDKNLSLQAQMQTALAKNLITKQEAKLIDEYETLRVQAIAVDEFSTDYALGSDICNNPQTEALIVNEQSIL